MTLEKHRLDALRDYGIFGMVPDKALSDLVKLTAVACHADIAMINVIDERQQHTLVAHGIAAAVVPREHSVCAQLLYSPNEMLVVADLQQDERFALGSFTARGDGLRGYAGVPLVTQDGYVLGALCICDREAREFSESELESLRVVGYQLMQMLEVRRLQAKVQESERTLQEMLTHLSGADTGVPGLLNRRAVEVRVEEEIKRAERGGSSLAVLMIDIDHFEIYTEAFGQESSDMVLEAVADVLKITARQHDAVGCYTKEKFAVIMPITDASGALDAGERFRETVETMVSAKCPITVSVGVACWTPGPFFIDGATEGRHLLEIAHGGLRLAKNLGGNRVAMQPSDADLIKVAA